MNSIVCFNNASNLKGRIARVENRQLCYRLNRRLHILNILSMKKCSKSHLDNCFNILFNHSSFFPISSFLQITKIQKENLGPRRQRNEILSSLLKCHKALQFMNEICANLVQLSQASLFIDPGPNIGCSKQKHCNNAKNRSDGQSTHQITDFDTST